MTINVTTPFSVSGSIAESDSQGGVTSYTVDFNNNSVTFNLVLGSVSGQSVIPGPVAAAAGKSVTVTVNMTTGAWTSSNGLSGTLSGAAFTNIVAAFKSIRNQMETFASGASGIMPGAQVAWT